MPYVGIHDDLPDHPKTILTASSLKIDKDALVGKLVRLWCWALDSRESGFLPYCDVETIAEKMRWSRKPLTLIDALCLAPEGKTCGFLERVEGGYQIHGWHEYTRHYYASLERLKQDRERKAQKKKCKNTRAADENAPVEAEYPDESGAEFPSEFQRSECGVDAEQMRNSALYRYPKRKPERMNEGILQQQACARVPIADSYRDYLITAYHDNYDEDARWDDLVRGGEYTADQLVGALEYVAKRSRQGVLRQPCSYAIEILVDWQARGLRNRDEIEAAKNAWTAGTEAIP